ncbi:MAG: hypothetical protein KAS01_00585 [Candidatus Pacebacteria bacterium]|nr:hypothetical protein [Candidatus Paceibacterota bacterium]
MRGILIKSAFFIILLFLMIGFLFFRKDEYKEKPSEEQSQIQQEEVQDGKVIRELTEEDKIKRLAETFASIYYSYSWGNFSNIESQYYQMTDEMMSRAKEGVEKMKKNNENQSQKYFTVRASLIDSEFLSYNKNIVKIGVNLSIDNFAGAIVQRDTMVWVDEIGNYYNGDLKNLITNTINKNIQIELIKIEDKWKVDEIMEIELRIKN